MEGPTERAAATAAGGGGGLPRGRVRSTYAEAAKDKICGVKVNVKAAAQIAGLAANVEGCVYPWDNTAGMLGFVLFSESGKRFAETLQLRGHVAAVQDVQFSPHFDDVLASASDDRTVCVWRLQSRADAAAAAAAAAESPDSSNPHIRPRQKLEGHSRASLVLSWHPTAAQFLASGGQEGTVKLWDLEEGSVAADFASIDGGAVSDVKWNPNGSLLGLMTKDKKLRILDPRAADAPVLVNDGDVHPGLRSGRFVWLGGAVRDGHEIFTVGFERGPGREWALWDIRKLAAEIDRQAIGRGASTLIPFYDADLGLLYLHGKGDSNMRLYDLTRGIPSAAGADATGVDSAVYALPEYRSVDPARGFAFIPKRGVDVMAHEVGRVLKADTATTIQTLRVICPRRGGFNDETHPPCLAGEPNYSNARAWYDAARSGKLPSVDDESHMPRVSMNPQDAGKLLPWILNAPIREGSKEALARSEACGKTAAAKRVGSKSIGAAASAPAAASPGLAAAGSRPGPASAGSGSAPAEATAANSSAGAGKTLSRSGSMNSAVLAPLPSIGEMKAIAAHAPARALSAVTPGLGVVGDPSFSAAIPAGTAAVGPPSISPSPSLRGTSSEMADLVQEVAQLRAAVARLTNENTELLSLFRACERAMKFAAVNGSDGGSHE